VGEALEILYAERRTEQAAELAHHYWQGEHWSKARDYSALAGDRALAAYANAEAQAHYARAVRQRSALQIRHHRPPPASTPTMARP
jgi:hypothetical protein